MVLRLVSTSWMLVTVLLCVSVNPRAQSVPDKYPLPAKEVKLAPQHRDAILSAMTVSVIVTARPLIQRDGDERVSVAYRAGRTGPDKAKGEVEQALKEWGAFSIVDDRAQADLVLVVLEETLSPSFGSKSDIRGPRYRLKDTLGVFRGRADDSSEPLWVGIVTEGRLSATLLKSPSAADVIARFKDDWENARKTKK